MRFPIWPRKDKQKSAAWQRPSLFLLTGGLLFVLGLLAGFYLFFPAETLKQRLIQEIEMRAGINVQVGQLNLYPFLTLAAKNLKLDLNVLPTPLEIEGLSVAPDWTSLFSGDPGVQLHGNLMNGTITAGMHQSGVIKAEAVGLHFELPLQKPLPVTIKGNLREASLDGATRLDANAKTMVLLHFADVGLLGLDFLKADGRGISLGEIILEAEGQGRAIKVKTLTAKGGDLDVNGSGTLLIGRTSESSRIKLGLQVRPGPNADPSITALLDLSGKSDEDGRYPLQLTGTVAKPILKSGG
jgi:type II secretion system protein N